MGEKSCAKFIFFGGRVFGPAPWFIVLVYFKRGILGGRGFGEDVPRLAKMFFGGFGEHILLCLFLGVGAKAKQIKEEASSLYVFNIHCFCLFSILISILMNSPKNS